MRKLMFPVAIDLGAASTGIFSLRYPEGSTLTELSKTPEREWKDIFVAEVPAIKNGGYKLLQTDRTANRHARRGRSRNQQAKRLIELILEVNFGFPASEHQEAIAELMNRRGYSFVESADLTLALPAETDFSSWLPHLSEKSTNWLVSLSDETLMDVIDATLEESSDILFELADVISEQGFDKSKGKENADRRAFAKGLQSLVSKLDKAAKHRSKYFTDIEHDIKHYTEHPSRSVRRLIHDLHCHEGLAKGLMLKQFHNLLCHVSNFELKATNKILRRKGTFKQADLLEQNVSEVFGWWVCKSWQTTAINTEHKQQIKKLRQHWKAFNVQQPGKVFEFWLQLNPINTIPPYQSHTNRNPPECQTLILSSEYLNKHYPNWQKWLSLLTSDAESQQLVSELSAELTAIIGKRGKPLVSSSEVNARCLQFVLDRSQKQDPYCLNKTWSLLKKAHELRRTEQDLTSIKKQLGDVMSASILPLDLKTPVIGDDQPQTSFWHLINLYYQTRRRARAGRVFIHYDVSQTAKRARWQTGQQLLQICQHRPRQLKYQALHDVLALWGISKTVVEQAISSDELSIEQIEGLLNNIRGIKTHAKECHGAQKKYGPELKQHLHTDSKLIKLTGAVIKDIEALAAFLFSDDVDAQKSFIDKNSSVYQLAQLHAIVWQDRSGFGKTCPVCSADNAQRAQRQTEHSQASRLNTLSMRLIDGGLKRLLNHQAQHIANRLFAQILPAIDKNQRVVMPLILEQNRFDFTEDLNRLKDRKVKPNSYDPEKPYQDKVQRIVAGAYGLCPYAAGHLTSAEQCEIDHIIPRSGPYGVLNDEANLICSSQFGNQSKGNRQLQLSDLAQTYLQQLFGTADNEKIRQFIEIQLGMNDSDYFSFGEYRQFIALTEDQQKAFRHALFLPNDHPLRAKVIGAIQHRSKSRVNGTQRYFAQLLADALWQRAAKMNKQALLNFDYFEVSSNRIDENSTVALRQYLETMNEGSAQDITAFSKQAGKSQLPFSHTIDAICAMTLVANAHRNEGAMRLALPDNCNPWGVDKVTGEVQLNLFNQLFLPAANLKRISVKPNSLYSKLPKLQEDGQLADFLSRAIHTENSVGLNYYAIGWRDGTLVRGWWQPGESKDNFYTEPGKLKPVAKDATQLQAFVEQGFYMPVPVNASTVWRPNKQKITEALFDCLSTFKEGVDKNHRHFKLAEFVLKNKAGSLYFYTTRKPLLAAAKIVADAKPSPYLKNWQHFFNGWKAIAPDSIKGTELNVEGQFSQTWKAYCESFLGRKEYPKQHRIQRNYSMQTTQSMNGSATLVKRMGTQSKAIYQLLPNDNSNLPKEYVAITCRYSPRMVWFDKTVLSKGYELPPEPERDYTGQQFDAELALLLETCAQRQLATDNVSVEILPGSKICLSGLARDWFESNMLIQRKGEGKSWYQRPSLEYAEKDLERDAIDSGVLKAILRIAPRADKPIGLECTDKAVSLTLVYKKEQLSKLLKTVNSH